MAMSLAHAAAQPWSSEAFFNWIHVKRTNASKVGAEASASGSLKDRIVGGMSPEPDRLLAAAVGVANFEGVNQSLYFVKDDW